MRLDFLDRAKSVCFLSRFFLLDLYALLIVFSLNQFKSVTFTDLSVVLCVSGPMWDITLKTLVHVYICEACSDSYNQPVVIVFCIHTFAAIYNNIQLVHVILDQVTFFSLVLSVQLEASLHYWVAAVATVNSQLISSIVIYGQILRDWRIPNIADIIVCMYMHVSLHGQLDPFPPLVLLCGMNQIYNTQQVKISCAFFPLIFSIHAQR